MDLVLVGAIIGFIASWAMFRRENWRLEDKLAEKQEQIDNMLRQQIRQGNVVWQDKDLDYSSKW